LLPEGAGAPLLPPRPRRRERGRGGQGEKSEGDHPPEGEADVATLIRGCGSASILHGAQAEGPSGGRTGRPIFSLLGRGGSAPFPLETNNERSEGSAAGRKPVRAPPDRLKGQQQEV
ncbi:hypothetical protein EOA49_31995, partial [Mesorhizobium sp. M1A.F.Ca.IN.020.04.1.1]